MLVFVRMASNFARPITSASSASSAGLLTLHVVLHHGKNTHHIVETIFKAVARALRAAVEADPRAAGIPSTKGVL